MRKWFFYLLILLAPLAAFSQKEDAILGYWKTGDGKAIIQVYKKGSKYHGKIVWLAEPKDPQTGAPKKDGKNENESLRGRPLLGLENLTGFVYDDGEWEDGEIYDPKSGETYSCTMEMPDANTLEVRGYVGISLFGKTDTWKRQKMK